MKKAKPHSGTSEPKKDRRGGPRPGSGQPPFTPTADQRTMATVMLGFGVPQDRCRRAVINPRTGKPIDEATFARAFADEIENARSEIDKLFSKTLYQQIKNGNTALFIFTLKNRWGWTDRLDQRFGAAGDQLLKSVKIEFVEPLPAKEDE